MSLLSNQILSVFWHFGQQDEFGHRGNLCRIYPAITRLQHCWTCITCITYKPVQAHSCQRKLTGVVTANQIWQLPIWRISQNAPYWIVCHHAVTVGIEAMIANQLPCKLDFCSMCQFCINPLTVGNHKRREILRVPLSCARPGLNPNQETSKTALSRKEAPIQI